MFELILLAGSITNSNGNLIITDNSDWADAAPNVRGDYAVFIVGEFRLSSEASSVPVVEGDPNADTQWVALTPADGRYSFTGYVFENEGVSVPSEGDVTYAAAGNLQQWTAGEWVEVELADVLAKAVYTSDVLEVPFLAYAYTEKNKLNLAYIKQVKHDIMHGIQQNKLYYARTDLDYYAAVIHGTEYNWALGLYSNFYEGVVDLTQIRETGIIQ
jgi:hypothetical protein